MTKLEGIAQAADRLSDEIDRVAAQDPRASGARVRGARDGDARRGIPEAARHSVPDGHRQDRNRRVAARAASRDRRSRSAPTWTRCRSTSRPACRSRRRFRARCTRAGTTRIRRSSSASLRCCPRCATTSPGRVMFIFQPAEETLTGAAAMLEAGAFADPAPDAIRRLPQLAAASHRHGRLASRRGDGVVRRVRRDDQGRRRARRASASRRRFDRRRGAVRQSAADDRQPRDRADQLGRRDDRPHCRRDGAQHHRAVGRVERVGAHAGVRDRRQGRGRRAPDPRRAQGRDARRLRAQMDEAHARPAQRQADDGARAERRARNARSRQRHRNAVARAWAARTSRGSPSACRRRICGSARRSTATTPRSIAPTTS